MECKYVLSDELLILLESYHQIEHPKKQQRKLFEKLIKAYEPSYLTNLAQLARIKNDLPEARYSRLEQSFAANSIKNESLESLTNKTLFKLILTADETHQQLPYYNIKNTNPFKPLSYHCKANESRKALKDYLQQLCAKAKTITICDNYFSDNWHNTQSLLHNTLPRSPLTIEYVETAKNTASTNNSSKFENQKIYDGWTIKQNQEERFENCHDRYLIIDNKIEVILTSGFDYLYKENKELTCIFREI